MCDVDDKRSVNYVFLKVSPGSGGRHVKFNDCLQPFRSFKILGAVENSYLGLLGR